ncbi:MAG TPA: hypothetical protein DEB17_03390 [Chlorobaculum sp.]|uniref:Uncharacterized protein n=1 Tax=Chlorobaculum tepidum (strain ATCC 49652 / DSM 12025 / NBRC 103806 / TLS) TaxID=194439 RepID=Q8KDN7_CHLTE|nr:hypothetical protein [Chlorobaculum tepidum]AAM72243.1 hypothetical protein CT1008 [Chlorobaculum tepidum TLS]HBU23029.1 hypothetical protein [Chlorobaculum sp.]
MKQIDLSSNQRIVFFTGACCIEINPEPSGAIGHDLVIGEPASRALPELFARK